MHQVTNASLVERFKVPKKKLRVPMPVYNADGTLNQLGKITEYVEVRMTVGDHSERIQLAVTKLSNPELFLGMDWLKDHNPSIDWTQGRLSFDRCPDACGYTAELGDVEDDEPCCPEPAMQLAEGEKLFAMDWQAYVNEGAQMRRVNIGGKGMQMVNDYIKEFKDVFSEAEFNALPERRPWDHVIELTPGFKPVNCKVYPLNPQEQKALDEFLEENLRTGRIRPSKSPMASPFFFIKKKDGSLRPVQDYRKLNEMTVKNRYPLPLIQELIDKLRQSRYFTKMDVRWGYNNIRIAEGDEWKAAFRTNRGLFEPTVMFFGLTNSPATFQTFMNHILRDEVIAGHVIVYLDDILIFTDSLEEHRPIVKRVLEILRKHKLYLRPEKCSFEKRSVDYLGTIVGNGELRMDPSKVSAVTDWPIPKNKKDIQSFIGFCNFYRRFIQGFSAIARPLTHLTKQVPWEWTETQQGSFETLKKALTSYPILRIPIDDAPFRVECDSSDFANGAILSQFIEGKWHPIAYRSRTLSETERNYEIYDKELMAITDSLQDWRQYLLGAEHVFEVWSDHKNLQY